MKKFIIVAVAVAVIASVVALGACSTDTISHTSYTSNMRFENPQTGEVTWIES